MVARLRKGGASEKEQKKSRVKVGKLKLNKETVKDLTAREIGKIRGGAAVISRNCGIDSRPRDCW